MSFIDDLQSLAARDISIKPFVDDKAGMVGFIFRSPVRDETGRNKFACAVHIDTIEPGPFGMGEAVLSLFSEAAEALAEMQKK